MRRTRGRHGSLYAMRHGNLNGSIAGTPGTVVIVDVSFFSPMIFANSSPAAKTAKSFTVRIGALYTDLAVTSSTAGNAPILAAECIYLADQNTIGATLYSGSTFLQTTNELAAGDPRALPPRILFRRTCFLNPVFGETASSNNNWGPVRLRSKVIVKEDETLQYRVEWFNQAANTQPGDYTVMAALAVKANP